MVSDFTDDMTTNGPREESKILCEKTHRFWINQSIIKLNIVQGRIVRWIERYMSGLSGGQNATWADCQVDRTLHDRIVTWPKSYVSDCDCLTCIILVKRPWPISVPPCDSNTLPSWYMCTKAPDWFIKASVNDIPNLVGRAQIPRFLHRFSLYYNTITYTIYTHVGYHT